jgi:DNA-binding SARP family transcriptional activator/Tfp pilus assembly protein PilF
MNKTLAKTGIAADEEKVVSLDLTRIRESGLRAELTRPIVRIHLLGPMRTTTYLGESILPRGKKARAILACLALAAGERVARGRLAAMLWDRVSDAQARASFRQGLRQLSSAMGKLAPELLSIDRETVSLNRDLCWIDARALLAPQLVQQSAVRGDLAALCTGELLEGLDGITASFDQLLLSERTRFSEQLSALLQEELRQSDQLSVEAEERASIARRMIVFDPTHEGASRILMKALADMGERAQAVREYVRCRKALRKTLDVEPSPETKALYEAIRAYSGNEKGAGESLDRNGLQLRQAGRAKRSARSRLRVGVLPFLAHSTRHEETLAFSLSQEIAAGLARFRWFDVIAPVSLVHEPAGPMSEDVLQRKGLDYVVEGALSGNGEQFLISVRLLDLSQYARPVWNDRFELDADSLHRLDELVTARIVSRIDPVILFIEGQPRRRQQYGATGLLLLAIPMIYSMERGQFEEAGRLIDRALQIDPENAMVMAWAAYWHMWHVGQGWTKDPTRTLETAKNLCLQAMRIDRENAEAMGIYAHICAWNKDFDQAVVFYDRCLRLNPNLAYIWALSAANCCYIGDPQEALKRMQRFRELSPFDPYFPFFENAYSIAYTFSRNYAEAVKVAQRVVDANPDFTNGYKPLLASLGYLGRLDEAKVYLKILLGREPDFTVQQFGQVYPFKYDADRQHYMEGLRRAGVPEGTPQ